MEEQYVSFSSPSFDPNEVGNLTSSAILCTVCIDISPSITDYVDSMNNALEKLYLSELKNSHRKNDILLKVIKFAHDVRNTTGFMPILSLDDDALHVSPTGKATALYKAVYTALEETMAYRNDLEAQGIECRSNILIITDGEDNASDHADLAKLVASVAKLRSNESWARTFTIKLIGVKDEANFKSAIKNMGLNPDNVLISVSATDKELRQAIGVVSQSVTSNSNTSITF